MIMASGSYTAVLWPLFTVTGVLTVAATAGIRLLFRRGKAATDL
jgi:hypothetical protein